MDPIYILNWRDKIEKILVDEMIDLSEEEKEVFTAEIIEFLKIMLTKGLLWGE